LVFYMPARSEKKKETEKLAQLLLKQAAIF